MSSSFVAAGPVPGIAFPVPSCLLLRRPPGRPPGRRPPVCLPAPAGPVPSSVLSVPVRPLSSSSDAAGPVSGIAFPVPSDLLLRRPPDRRPPGVVRQWPDQSREMRSRSRLASSSVVLQVVSQRPPDRSRVVCSRSRSDCRPPGRRAPGEVRQWPDQSLEMRSRSDPASSVVHRWPKRDRELWSSSSRSFSGACPTSPG